MATVRGGAREAEEYASFLERQSWTSHSDACMTRPRWGCAAVEVDGHIVALGGKKDDDEVSSSVERSAVHRSKDDTSTLTLSRWSALPNKIIKQWWFGAAVVPHNFGVSDDSDGAKPNILVAGGFTTQSSRSACAEAEMFDLSSNQWRKLPSMQRKRGACAVTSGSGEGCVYAVGGYDGSKRLGSVECLSFSAQDGGAREPSWTLLASHMKHPRIRCAAVVVEGRPVHPTGRTAPRQLVVMGGYADNGHTNSVEAYDFETGQWEELPPMKEKRDGCAAVAVGQCIYVVGGHNGEECLATAEYFDFRTRQWTLLPRMSKRRWGCAAVVVGGHMVVLGGWNGSNELKCVESLTIAVNDTATHEIELPDLPPPTTAVGVANRMQPLEQWCGTVEALLGKVEADIDERKEMMKKTREEKIEAAEVRRKAEIEAVEERKRDDINAAEEGYNVDMAALESRSDEWVRVTRHQLQEAQLEMEGLRLIANKTSSWITTVSSFKTPPPRPFAETTQSRLQVFLQDADGDLVRIQIPQGDYAALKQLAAEELNVSPDVISKFRRKSDGVVAKSDRHMWGLKPDDELEVVTKNSAPAQTTGNVTSRLVGGGK